MECIPKSWKLLGKVNGSRKVFETDKVDPQQKYALVLFGNGFQSYVIRAVTYYSSKEQIEEDMLPNRVQWLKP